MTCPRCSGFVMINQDRHGAYRECVNCGWTEPIDSYDPEGKLQAAPRGKRPRYGHHQARSRR